MRNFTDRNSWRNSRLRQMLPVVAALVVAALCAAGPLRGAKSPQQVAQADPPAAKNAPAKPGGNPADAYLSQAQRTLAARQSVRADLLEIVSLGDPPFRMLGSYVGAGLKLRLEFSVKLPGGAQGSLLEVSDGERLWSQLELPGSKRVTRRDVRQILAALEDARLQPGRAPAANLALGGLPALLASLQRSMQFDALKEETLDGHAVVVLQGRWKNDILARFGATPEAGELPPQVPDLVRIYFAADTQFPEKLLYLKRLPEKKSYRPLVELQFRNVVLDGPLDEREFDFTPPDNIEPEDITRQYIEQLLPPQKPADAKP